MEALLQGDGPPDLGWNPTSKKKEQGFLNYKKHDLGDHVPLHPLPLWIQHSSCRFQRDGAPICRWFSIPPGPGKHELVLLCSIDLCLDAEADPPGCNSLPFPSDPQRLTTHSTMDHEPVKGALSCGNERFIEVHQEKHVHKMPKLGRTTVRDSEKRNCLARGSLAGLYTIYKFNP